MFGAAPATEAARVRGGPAAGRGGRGRKSSKGPSSSPRRLAHEGGELDCQEPESCCSRSCCKPGAEGPLVAPAPSPDGGVGPPLPPGVLMPPGRVVGRGDVSVQKELW